ncbi:MAG TPA: CHAT domain-containing protein [Micromonosporaceae bacterium]|nr:CHAT domain-containing protein [Micromonosporaceae bacterium]
MGDVVHGDKLVYGDKVVGTKVVAPFPAEGVPERPTLLVLSANPSDTTPLRLDHERRRIVESIAAVQALTRLDVRMADAVQVDDLHHRLLQYRPVGLHFAGHGSTDGVVIEDSDGYRRRIPAAALADLVAIFTPPLRCVVLNACYTDAQAEAIAGRGPCVVGMRGPVPDDIAIHFAAGFYAAAADGMSVRQAFDLGKNRLSLRQISAHPPVLAAAPGIAEQTFLVEPP